jgi:hypothetical protein
LQSARQKSRRGFSSGGGFFGYAKRLNQMRAALQADLAEVDETYQGRSELAKGLANLTLIFQF